MRRIGHLPEERLARRFGNHLYGQGIRNLVEGEPDGRWGVWVESEDHIDNAREQLERFRENPDDPAYDGAAEAARTVKVEEREAEQRYRRQYVDVASRWGLRDPRRIGPVTLVLIVAAVVVTALTWFGNTNEPLQGWLTITRIEETATGITYRTGLPEVRRGQLWRLVTPILLHFHPFHILFNMWWLNDLGSLVEKRRSSWLLAALVLVSAVASNLAQYAVAGPLFGGMSGVVYALAGFIWIRGKRDPASGLHLPRPALVILLVWFALCWTGLLGPVANTAHTVGLGVGMAWGLVSSVRGRRPR